MADRRVCTGRPWAVMLPARAPASGVTVEQVKEVAATRRAWMVDAVLLCLRSRELKTLAMSVALYHGVALSHLLSLFEPFV